LWKLEGEAVVVVEEVVEVDMEVMEADPAILTPAEPVDTLTT